MTFGITHLVVLLSEEAEPAAVASQDHVASVIAGPGNRAWPVFLLFQTLVTLDHAVLKVDGREMHLTPGIAGSAEIATGQRRLITFFLTRCGRLRLRVCVNDERRSLCVVL